MIAISGRGLISPHDLHLYKITDNVDEAVNEVRHFYSNFHSVRYSRDDIIIRLQRRPTEKQLAEVTEKFSDIKVKGESTQLGAAKVAKMQLRIYEVPVSYHARTREQGKKITWRDGVAALWIIARCRLFWRVSPQSFATASPGTPPAR